MSKNTKQLLGLVLLGLLLYSYGWQPSTGPVTSTPTTAAVLQQAVARQQSKVWFSNIAFTVYKLLPDDNEGSRHQRFLVSHPELPRLLVAHNIDLASRVPLQPGDTVTISGRYEWNNKGGVIHWTHYDPGGRQPGGVIIHQGKHYGSAL